MTPREAIPKSWTDYLTEGVIGVGMDLATTANKTSNPSSITVTQKVGNIYHTRLVVSFKTADPEVSEEMLKIILQDIAAISRTRRICLDASSEIFFATKLKKKILKFATVELVKGGSKVSYKGEEMNSKTLLGNIYVNLFEDGLITLPLGDWLRDDHRLVTKDRGSFLTLLGRNGEHGDTFDSGKLSIWAIEKGSGRARATATAVGSMGGKSQNLRPGLIGPIGKKMKAFFSRNNY